MNDETEPWADDDTIRRLLTETTVWAVVGCSPDPTRDSHGLAQALRAWGKTAIPVNPTVDEIDGETCYPALPAIPRDVGVEVVDLFRRSDQVAPHVDEAIEIGASALWMQLGVVDLAAAERASAAGLDVVMNRCPKVERRRLFP